MSRIRGQLLLLGGGEKAGSTGGLRWSPWCGAGGSSVGRTPSLWPSHLFPGLFFCCVVSTVCCSIELSLQKRFVGRSVMVPDLR